MKSILKRGGNCINNPRQHMIFSFFYFQNRVQEMLRPNPVDSIIESSPTLLVPSNLNTAVKSVFDWKCVLLGSLRPEDCTYYLGMGRNKNYFYNKLQRRWAPVPHR